MRSLAFTLFSLAILGPGIARAQSFSAQDVMSVCMTTPQDMQQIYAILETRGWDDVAGQPSEKIFQELRVAFVAAQYIKARPIHGTADAEASWKQKWLVARTFLADGLVPDRDKLFLHEQSGSLLLVVDYLTKLARRFSCLLAVPIDQLDANSYFPKLRSPTAPDLSLVMGDYIDSEAMRSGFAIQAAALDSKGLSRALGIQTEVGAAFYSFVSFPLLAVKP